eukprot:PhM_4_TR5038/c0_g1_i2/m.48866
MIHTHDPNYSFPVEANDTFVDSLLFTTRFEAISAFQRHRSEYVRRCEATEWTDIIEEWRSEHIVMLQREAAREEEEAFARRKRHFFTLHDLGIGTKHWMVNAQRTLDLMEAQAREAIDAEQENARSTFTKDEPICRNAVMEYLFESEMNAVLVPPKKTTQLKALAAHPTSSYCMPKQSSASLLRVIDTEHGFRDAIIVQEAADREQLLRNMRRGLFHLMRVVYAKKGKKFEEAPSDQDMLVISLYEDWDARVEWFKRERAHYELTRPMLKYVALE